MVFRESDLLERFRAGDVAALETVYRACVDQVTRVAEAVLRACSSGNTRGAGEIGAALADIVQEVFVKAFAPEARRRFDASRAYEPYVAQIARNVAIDHWRQMKRYVPADIDEIVDRLSIDEPSGNATANDWSDAETVGVVNRFLASLDEESRRVHDALYVKGMSQRDAAEMLGLGRQVIRTREAKLREGLRRELSRAARVEALPLRVSKQSG